MTTDLIATGRQTALTANSITGDTYASFIAYLDVAQKSIETYTKNIRQFARYMADKGISQPQREDILAYKEYLAETGHKASTIQGYIIAVRLFFQWAEQNGIYPDVAKHIKGAKLTREHKKDYLTSSQVKTILRSIERDTLKGKRDYAILTLAVTTGLRTIEIQRADVADLGTAGDNTVLYIQGKGHADKDDFVKLPAQTEAAIRDYLKARGEVTATAPLFTSTSHNNAGERMTTRAISALIKQRFQNAGYDSERLTAHSTRHTAVTLALLNGESLEEVQQFARHANITTTQIYAHNLDKANNTCSSSIASAIF